MLRRVSSQNVKRLRRPTALLALVSFVLVTVAGCGVAGIDQTSSTGAAPPASATTSSPSAAHTTTLQSRQNLYTIDALVRSQDVAGIDLHLRYAERSADGLILHLAFYNNSDADLLAVPGIDPAAAHLVGTTREAPIARSVSLAEGIVPEGGWYVGGATNGTLTFAPASGSNFTLEFPGFPPVPFRLDTPLREVPDAPAPQPATYVYDFEVPSASSGDLTATILGAVVTDDRLDLELSVRSTTETTPLPADLSRALLFDARWNQYRPLGNADILGDVASGSVDSAQDATTTRVVLHFARPVTGNVVLLKLPSFPLIRIPLRPGDEPAWAGIADVPPSVEPRVAALPTQPPRPERVGNALETLLREVNRALAAGDRQAYVEAFMPEVREHQGAIFDRTRALPLDAIAFEPGQSDRGMQAGTDELVVAGDEVRGYHATWTYHVRDVEAANVFAANIVLDFQRDGATWRIAAIRGDLPFWALGPTEAQRSGAFWIFYRPEESAELAAISEDVSAAFARISDAFPERTPGPYVVFVTASPDEFGALTGRDASRFLGMASSRWTVSTDTIRIAGAAFYLNGAIFRDDPSQNRLQTITHELTHLTLAPQTMPFTPLWVVEGMAMEITNDLPVGAMETAWTSGDIAAWSLDEFTGVRQFGEHDPMGQQLSLEYAYSAYLARYLVTTYGFEKYLTFYESFAAVPFDSIQAELSAATTPAEIDTAMSTLARRITPQQLQHAFGIDMPTLGHDFKAWLDTQF